MLLSEHADQIAEPNPMCPVTTRTCYVKCSVPVFKTGINSPVRLNECIEAIDEPSTMLPLQAGDGPDTYADATESMRALDYKPATPVKQGVARFV